MIHEGAGSGDGAIDRDAPVRAGEELDAGALGAWLAQQGIVAAHTALAITQFPRGFSNLTYLVRAGVVELILRRPPFGVGKGTAHDVVREARILESLGRAYDKVPRVVATCEGDSPIGAPFYLMERVRGIILRDRIPAGVALEPAALRRLCTNAIDALAEIHAVNHGAAGLGTLGNPAGYVDRQVAGWSKRYAAAATHDQPAVERCAEWLAAHRPPEQGSALVHNDFKLDNLVLDAADPTRILAVLDWEMATIGDPLMDLGTTLAYWVEASDAPAIRSLGLGVTSVPGMLSRREVVARYEEVATRAIGDAIVFYYAFGLFKVAVIAQQIHARWVRGLTSDPRFAHLDRAVAALGEGAIHAIETGTIAPAERR